MNVLEIYPNFLPQRGGVEKHMLDLCKCMIQRGHKPVILAWSTSYSSLKIIEGIEVHRVRVPSLFCFMRYPLILFLSFHILRLTKRYNVDILHAHDYLPGVAAVLTGFFMKKPVVVTFHLCIQATTYPHFYVSPLFLVEKMLKKCFVFWVSKIICVSMFTYRQTVSLGFPSSKLKVIYNWASLPKEGWVKNTLKKFNLNEKRYILSVGRLVEQTKHFSMLISAFKSLLDRGYELDLVIVGDGPDKEFYRKYSKGLNVEKHVHFLVVSDEDLGVLYDGCELFVMTSLFEGLPLVILEAMAHGKAVVATKTGGIPEVIKNNYNGLVVSDYADLVLGIEKLLLQPSIRRVFGKRSKEIVIEKFSENNCKQTVVSLENLAFMLMEKMK